MELMIIFQTDKNDPKQLKTSNRSSNRAKVKLYTIYTSLSNIPIDCSTIVIETMGLHTDKSPKCGNPHAGSGNSLDAIAIRIKMSLVCGYAEVYDRERIAIGSEYATDGAEYELVRLNCYFFENRLN